jgi:hypothetical protein
MVCPTLDRGKSSGLTLGQMLEQKTASSAAGGLHGFLPHRTAYGF